MLTKIYSILFYLSTFVAFGQIDIVSVIKNKTPHISIDSTFILIDNKLEELQNKKTPDSTIVSLLQYKLHLADSTGNRVAQLLTYESLEDYPSQFTTDEFYKIVSKKAKHQNNLGKSDEAIITYFRLIEYSDSIQNDSLLANVYRSIGIMYKNQNNVDLSLKYNAKALAIEKERQDSIGLINVYMNMGNAFKKRADSSFGDFDSAFFYYSKSLALSEKKNYQKGMAGNHNNLGSLYRLQKQYDKAINAFFTALEINKENGNDLWASFNYNNLGSTYQNMNNSKTALIYLKKSLELKQKLNNEKSIIATLENISNTYAGIKEYEQAYINLIKAKKLREKYENQNKLKLTQELEAEFQNERKENEINNLKSQQTLQEIIINGQQKDLNQQEELRKKEKNLIYALAFILLSLMVTVLVFWRSNQQKKKYNQELKTKNIKIKQFSEEVKKAHTNLAIKNKEITDSINYAKRIQAAILPSQKTFDSYLKESFVIYLPKDIVAGDFYWTEKIGDIVLFAVADCTGHGVPGAMVSVICHNALNATTKRLGSTNPGKILDETTRIVLRQFEKSEETVNDGMDIALCAFNTITKELQFAGANTPLWLVRKGKVYKHPATRQPVGNYRKLVAFKTNNIQIQEGDSIYLSSDGYPDQFGGEKGKKFMYKRFKQTLINLSQEPIHSQKSILHETFYTWKDRYEQVDDVCIMGIKI